MSDTIIPAAVRKYAANLGMNATRLLGKDLAEYGDVFEIYVKVKPGGLPLPTGMPVVVSYKEGRCIPLDSDLAFELLATLGK